MTTPPCQHDDEEMDPCGCICPRCLDPEGPPGECCICPNCLECKEIREMEVLTTPPHAHCPTCACCPSGGEG